VAGDYQIRGQISQGLEYKATVWNARVGQCECGALCGLLAIEQQIEIYFARAPVNFPVTCSCTPLVALNLQQALEQLQWW